MNCISFIYFKQQFHKITKKYVIEYTMAKDNLFYENYVYFYVSDKKI